ncbi:MAG: hypothetical protein ACHQUB_01105 [Candidatus Saccharimonadia bacterium]
MLFEDVELEFNRIKAVVEEIRQDSSFKSSAHEEMTLISSGYHLIDQAIAVRYAHMVGPEVKNHSVLVVDDSLAWLTNQVTQDIFWMTMGEKLERDVRPAVERFAQVSLPHAGHHFVSELAQLVSA